MRILFVSHIQDSKPTKSAIGLVLASLAKALVKLGHTVDTKGREDTEELELDDHYDVMHCGWLGLLPGFPSEIPVTVNLWNIPLHRAISYHGRMAMCPPARIVVDDVYTIQTLGQLGMHNYNLIPLAFDYEKKTLPTPEGPFTVGVFGNDYRLQEPCQLVEPGGGSFQIAAGFSTKRFAVAEEACRRAEIDYYPCIQDSGRRMYLLDPVEDVYKHIHVLAHTSIMDTNSMPAREALFCGRPVIATRNGGLERIIEHGVNGYFFDGSVEDLQMKLIMAKVNYEPLAMGARLTKPEMTVDETAKLYEEMWQQCIEN